MCHGKDGSGNGIVMEYGWYKPRPYWADHIVSYTEVNYLILSLMVTIQCQAMAHKLKKKIVGLLLLT